VCASYQVRGILATAMPVREVKASVVAGKSRAGRRKCAPGRLRATLITRLQWWLSRQRLAGNRVARGS
jgi:hypothetical protein